MTIEDLEIELADLLNCNIIIKKVKGKIVINTDLVEEYDGELVQAEKEADESEEEVDEENLDILE